MSFAENFGMQRFISPSIDFDELYGGEMSRQAMLDSFRMAGENPAIGYLANAQKAKYAMEAAKIAAMTPEEPHGANQFLSGASGLMGMASGFKGALGGLGGTPVTNAHKGLGGFGPVADGNAYGAFLEGTAGTSGIGPFANGDIYGSFLSRK
tara:strand:- start:1171 stop:1626 length:456 start_codon:yes stop_codon:yes gene_type:complete